MKDLGKTIGKILFWIFAAVVFLWTASLTLAEVRVILPNDPVTPYFALFLLDIGALTWLLTFIGKAKGLMQRSIAILMTVVDLAGVVLLSGGRLLTAGQSLTDIPKELGAAIVYGLIVMTIVNLVAIYVFHVSEPTVMKEINFGVLTDRLEKEALEQAERNIEAQAQQLGAILAARATANLKYSLRLPMSDQEAMHMLSDSQMQQPASQLVIDAQPARGKVRNERSSASPSFLTKIREKFSKQPIPSPIAQPAAAAVTYQQTAPAVQPETIAGDPIEPPKQEEAPAAGGPFPG